MKTLKQYITEKLKIQKNIEKTEHTLFPKSKEELYKMIKDEIDKNGNECSLNHIDVSRLNDMSYLFYDGLEDFDGDISEWDVSNVEDMEGMFYKSKFTGENGDISKWNVRAVIDMQDMFRYSKFSGDIGDWNVSNVTNMRHMFRECPFNGDISNWDVSNVEDVAYMFYKNDVFNKDISMWNLKSVEYSSGVFNSSLLQDKKEFWPKALR